MEQRAIVLYIGGHGRSGSTLFGRLVALAPRAVFVGEARLIWQHGVAGNYPCGCGLPFHDCDFWRAVGKEAFGGWSETDPTLHQVTVGHAELSYTLARWATVDRALFAEYTRQLGRLYSAIRTVANADVVVDSSKIPAHAFALSRTPAIHTRVVHLIRDPRAVAHSATRSRGEPDGRGGIRLLPRNTSWTVSKKWTVRNAWFEVLARSVPTGRIFYEEFATDPGPAIARAVRFAGLEMSSVDDTVSLPVSHSVAGNPNRRDTGTVRVALDDEWRARADPRRTRIVTALTWPMLKRYGYRV